MSENSLPLNFGELEKRIEYSFQDKSLIKTALTRSSYSNEQKMKNEFLRCNERLEFLGDSVLSLITSVYIFKNYKKLPEGELTKLRAAVVCESALFEYSKEIGMGNYLFVGHCEEITGGRERRSSLADAFEALLAAIYLDGGFEKAQGFVLPFVTRHAETLMKKGLCDDYKSRLQMFIQQTKGDTLVYELTDESGPAHQKNFTVEVHLNSNVIGKGTGTSKREAEQIAAREALVLFGELDEKSDT